MKRLEKREELVLSIIKLIIGTVGILLGIVNLCIKIFEKSRNVRDFILISIGMIACLVIVILEASFFKNFFKTSKREEER